MEALIAALVGFIIAATALIKMWTDILAIRRDRMSTKETRDKDSQDMHDELIKLKMQVTQVKDNQDHHAQIMEDLRDTTALLNTNVAKLGVVVDTLSETVKELKRDRV